ncbi:MAG: protein kinase [Planctomycetota bacterium]
MKQLGEYRILERLGAGGTATVYRAVRDGVEVALKVLTDPELDASRVERFEREAELLSRLEHPGLLRVTDWGQIDGQYYICTELLSGRTLLDNVLPADDTSSTRAGEVLKWILLRFEEVAQTLQYLHENGIVHRDVKPDNIFLDADGRARLGDLGIAHDDLQHTITYDGEFLGTPHYVSPEQAMAGRVPVDHRTDIYSLGVSLFFCLTGDHAFNAASYQDVLRQVILENPPLLRRVRPGLSRDLESIVAQCMEKDCRHRYATAADLAADLRRVRNYQAVSARQPLRLRRIVRWLRKYRTAILVVIAVAALSGVGLQQLALNEQRYLGWVVVEPRELGGATDVDVEIRPIEGEGGAVPRFGGVRSLGRDVFQVQPMVPVELVLRRGNRIRRLRHVFTPLRAGVLQYRWRDETPEELGFVRVEAEQTFYVRPVPLTAGDLASVLSQITLSDTSRALGFNHARSLAVGDPDAPVPTSTLHVAQVAATALGFRLLTSAEWDQLRDALARDRVKGSAKQRESLRRIILEPPHELLGCLTRGRTEAGQPMSPRQPCSESTHEPYEVVAHGPRVTESELVYMPGLLIAPVDSPMSDKWTVLLGLGAE